MKHLFFLLFTIAALTSNAQILKQGDNLKIEFEKISTPYYFKAPSFTGWTEGKDMLLICNKPNPMDCDFVFLALRDTTLVGIYTIKAPNAFLLDTEGNSILSSGSEFFLLPLWTVKKNTQVIPADKAVFSLLDKMYEKSLQADSPQLDEATIKEYQQYKFDTTLPNRHIALLFDNYQTIITSTSARGERSPAELCIPIITSLSAECHSLYKNIPAIVCIYMGEALLSAGIIDKATEHFKISLQLYPNSIPLLVYNYRLEQDLKKKDEQLAKLKKKHTNHWMVKDL
ncbi:hypothetical protein FAZ15_01030 [Sphingobacterium olei]|uniref:Tetratricopeptide repeat protein n=1 Tax=Sphingobacterium olei TaxID=2571155 RepID=A0A4U0P656_9SPHI|nr:hypothetical protein [Sphingobacterium olei]TJZ62921.1 hypothetical protein FAZ15_01030 [Sphingobacterium olei]